MSLAGELDLAVSTAYGELDLAVSTAYGELDLAVSTAYGELDLDRRDENSGDLLASTSATAGGGSVILRVGGDIDLSTLLEASTLKRRWS